MVNSIYRKRTSFFFLLVQFFICSNQRASLPISCALNSRRIEEIYYFNSRIFLIQSTYYFNFSIQHSGGALTLESSGILAIQPNPMAFSQLEHTLITEQIYNNCFLKLCLTLSLIFGSFRNDRLVTYNYHTYFITHSSPCKIEDNKTQKYR